jgi:hypothetical protein
LADKVKNEKEKEKENSKTVLRKKKIHLSNQKNRKKANMAGAIVTSGSLFSLLNSNRLSLSLPPPLLRISTAISLSHLQLNNPFIIHEFIISFLL